MAQDAPISAEDNRTHDDTQDDGQRWDCGDHSLALPEGAIDVERTRILHPRVHDDIKRSRAQAGPRSPGYALPARA